MLKRDEGCYILGKEKVVSETPIISDIEELMSEFALKEFVLIQVLKACMKQQH